MDLRSQLFKAGTAQRKTVELVGADGTKTEVDVVALSMDARGNLLNDCQRTIIDDDGEESQEMDLKKMTPALVIECAVIPGTDTRIFSNEDRDAIGALSAGYFDPVIKAATLLSGLSSGAEKAAEKNLKTLT